jgi:hypothetical protein
LELLILKVASVPAESVDTRPIPVKFSEVLVLAMEMSEEISLAGMLGKSLPEQLVQVNVHAEPVLKVKVMAVLRRTASALARLKPL